MKLIIEEDEKSVTVLTPTTGNVDRLKSVIDTVQAQTYKNLKHLVVIDDPKPRLFLGGEPKNVTITHTPIKTGEGGFYGHRILAAYPHLINSDYIAFLDDDNTWAPNHIESLVKKIEELNLDWAHSLRKVFINGEFLADDCCESIGRWPVAWDTSQYLVDTSSYCFKREWLIQVCQLWHSGWGGDRRFFMAIKDHCNYDTTGLHTLNYELPDMNKAYGGQTRIFEEFNRAMLRKHGGKYPWN